VLETLPEIGMKSMPIGLANLRVDGWKPLIQLVLASDLAAKNK
jgi:hypothetical protein